MITVIIAAPLLLLLVLSSLEPDVRYRFLIGLGFFQFILVSALFGSRSDPLPLLNSFSVSNENYSFLLAYVTMQLMAFLTIPRGLRTVDGLLGAVSLSAGSIATIAANSETSFLISFLCSLLVPLLLVVKDESKIQDRRLLLILSSLCGVLLLFSRIAPPSFSAQLIAILVFSAASIRLGLVPFHLWARRTILGLPIQWGVLYFLTFPALSLVVRYKMYELSSPANTLLFSFGIIAAIYGSWLALVQRDLRTAYYYLLLSFIGAISIGFALLGDSLDGVVLFWFSGSLALGGFGFVVEILEARFGSFDIKESRGLVAQAPLLAAVFILLGLASVGFPGFCAFFGEEVMLSKIFHRNGWAITPILLALSLNGITVMRWFFAVFLGPVPSQTEGMDLLRRERLAFVILLVIIIGSGLYPRPLFELGAQIAADHSQAHEVQR